MGGPKEQTHAAEIPYSQAQDEVEAAARSRFEQNREKFEELFVRNVKLREQEKLQAKRNIERQNINLGAPENLKKFLKKCKAVSAGLKLGPVPEDMIPILSRAPEKQPQIDVSDGAAVSVESESAHRDTTDTELDPQLSGEDSKPEESPEEDSVTNLENATSRNIQIACKVLQLRARIQAVTQVTDDEEKNDMFAEIALTKLRLELTRLNSPTEVLAWLDWCLSENGDEIGDGLKSLLEQDLATDPLVQSPALEQEARQIDPRNQAGRKLPRVLEKMSGFIFDMELQRLKSIGEPNHWSIRLITWKGFEIGADIETPVEGGEASSSLPSLTTDENGETTVHTLKRMKIVPRHLPDVLLSLKDMLPRDERDLITNKGPNGEDMYAVRCWHVVSSKGSTQTILEVSIKKLDDSMAGA
ncbi:uncharacterized protein RCC_03533 [Ramularia collo-cygni]|uniref:Uncharacterized protein n=1 Tax=Ramularia collo-cygni TaxID=112498 RepID=A0A2D3V2D5_9PEZI|nr:uncharacterized protein RCC_03533 [Ramularia collo-cygni]CZT17696.1 uncharacterized protein RCC_03533 [Ramularia collo-cygni]